MSVPFPGELDVAIARAATVAHLLVISDFDGVLAPIVAEPTMAETSPQALVAMEFLVDLPQTSVAVVSGRALSDLAALARLPDAVRLVGSHGVEFDGQFAREMSVDQVRLHEKLQQALATIAKVSPGVQLEVKPASVAVHYRNASQEAAERAIQAIRSGPAAWTDIHVTVGKKVIELSVLATDKGAAVEALRATVSASAVVFLGDDVTDEDAFARLRDDDIGIKVGPGPTRASFWVPDPAAATRTLLDLGRQRAQWLGVGEVAQEP